MKLLTESHIKSDLIELFFNITNFLEIMKLTETSQLFFISKILILFLKFLNFLIKIT